VLQVARFRIMCHLPYEFPSTLRGSNGDKHGVVWCVSNSGMIELGICIIAAYRASGLNFVNNGFVH